MSAKAFRIREAASVRRSAGRPGQQQNQVGESAESIRRAHRRGRGTYSRHARTHSRRRVGDTEGGSRGPTASGGGPSAGGRLRRRTVEHQSSLLMKTDRTSRLPPTRTTSVGQVGHRRRAMPAASPSFLTHFFPALPMSCRVSPGLTRALLGGGGGV